LYRARTRQSYKQLFESLYNKKLHKKTYIFQFFLLNFLNTLSLISHIHTLTFALSFLLLSSLLLSSFLPFFPSPFSLLPFSLLPSSLLPFFPSPFFPSPFFPSPFFPSPFSLLPFSLLPSSLLPSPFFPSPFSLLPPSLLPFSLLPSSLLPFSLLPFSFLPLPLPSSLFSLLHSFPPFSVVLINVAAPQRGDRVTTSFFFKKTWLSQQRLAKIFPKKLSYTYGGWVRQFQLFFSFRNNIFFYLIIFTYIFFFLIFLILFF
jgi:hypothetical protein